MREILFRGKRKDNGEWVEGFYFCMVHDDGSHVHHFIMPLGADLSLGTPIEKIQVEIDIETLCQYTNLTDKNGNMIWENDVVCTPYVDPIFGDMVNDEILDDYTWKVVFVDGGFCVENEDKIINLRSFTNGNHIKAIGNIFDNACIDELLKGEEG